MLGPGEECHGNGCQVCAGKEGRQDLNMSGVKGERTKFLDQLMLLDLRKRLQRGDKAEQQQNIMSINYTEKEQGGVKGQMGYQGGYIRCWHGTQVKS